MGVCYQFLGAYYQFLGACFLLGEHYHFYIDCVGARFYWGVIINNWGHIITFWGRGFIGGNYHYLGARLLATSSWHAKDAVNVMFSSAIVAPEVVARQIKLHRHINATHSSGGESTTEFSSMLKVRLVLRESVSATRLEWVTGLLVAYLPERSCRKP